MELMIVLVGLVVVWFLHRKINSRLLYLEMRNNALARLFFEKEFAYYNELENDTEDDPDALIVKGEYQQKTIKELNEKYKKALFDELDHASESELFRKIKILKQNYNQGFFDSSYPWYQLLTTKDINNYELECRKLFKK